MNIQLPLEVLGLVAPVLTWVEGREPIRLPRRGQPRDSSIEEAEEAWLRRELPTYSRDTVDEILQLTRDDADPPAADWLSRGDARRQPMVPPADYDLATAFDRLGDRYFQWNGNELCVRAGRLEELHELGSRFPVCHLIRHRHARASIEGFLTQRRAVELPERLGALPSASRSLRVLIERGLSEGHIHFWGVTHADEVWANHLLAPPAAGKGGELSAAEIRLLQLGRFSLRILALAILLAKRRIPRSGRDLPYDLLRRLDELYHANSPWMERQLARKLDSLLREELTRTCFPEEDSKGGGEAAPLRAGELDPEERAWLLSIIDPAARRIPRFDEQRRGHRPEGGNPVPVPLRGNPLHRRIRRLERLHLCAQQQLIELSQTVEGFIAERRDSFWSNCYRFLQDFLHQAFFRYLVYHTQHMQLAIQGGTTTGLREFGEFYGARQRQLLGPERLWEHRLVLDRLLDTDKLRLLEGRTSLPAQGCNGLMPWLIAFADRRGRPMEKLGVVIHFIKQSHDDARAERRRHRAEERGFRVPRLRHEDYRRKVKHEAFRLFHQLSQPHPVVPFIVGIDAANVELTTPPELLAPAFRFLREFPIESRRLPSLRLRFGVEQEVLTLLAQRRLGVTYHVGEDFRHIISGLRAIFEVITFMDLKPGDRMGHATALALDPEVWAAQVGYQAVLTKQEWLDSLVWLHHFLGPGHDLVGELGIEDQIQYLSWNIFKDPHITYYSRPQDLPDRKRKSARAHGDWSLMLWDAWRLRQLDPTALSIDALRENKDPFPRRMPIGHWERRWAHVQRRVWSKISEEIGSYGAYELLERYWYDPQVRRRGDEVIPVDMWDKRKQWMAVCLSAQERLKDLVQRRQLVVEVNPSCNRMVGPMQDLAEHHIFDLTLDEKDRLARKVVTTVNTDNPGVFNTSLAHEYYLLGEILLRRGVPEGDVVEWLEWLRTNGADYTFLRFLPAPGEDADLQKILEALRKDRGSFTGWLRGERRFPGATREQRVELTDRQKQALLEALKKELLPASSSRGSSR